MSELNKAVWTDEFAQELKAVMSSPEIVADGVHGYYLGVLTAVMLGKAGVLPTRSMLERAAKCDSIPEAVTVAEAFAEDVLRSQERKARERAELPYDAMGDYSRG